MNKKIIHFCNILLIFLLSCTSSSEDDCVKEIIIQPELTVTGPTGSTFIPEVRQEVPCDFPEPEEVKVITELPKLENFTYEVLEINIIPDTGNNTSKLSYSIKLNNLSNKKVKGIPYLTTRINNDSITVSYAFNQGCSEVEANSSCTINFENESSLDLGKLTTFSIENVEYLILQ